MTDDKASQKTCVSCGATNGNEKISDKLKFQNKTGGTIYIHYKVDGKEGMLCRNCWQKYIKQFHDKIAQSNKQK